jgi:hypothetical protein
MVNQEPPSFEDLEPEGQDVEMPDGFGNAEEFEGEGLDEFPMGALGEYEFGDLEEFKDLEDDEFSRNRRSMPPRRTLASLAARIALKWGGRATAASVFGGNSRRPVALKPVRTPAGLFEEEYLDEPEADLLNGASAALLEDYELMEALAAAAVAAEDEAEAEGLIAAAIPLSIRLAPTVYRALWPAIPALINGTVGVTRLLHRRSATRPRIKLIPTILRRTTVQLARHAAHGQPVTRRLASKVLAGQTAAALQHWRGPRPASRRAVRSKRRPRRLHDPYRLEEWWDDGYGA